MSAVKEVLQPAHFANLRIAELMRDSVLSIYEGWSVLRSANFLTEHQLSSAPVIAADGELVGEITPAEVLDFQERVFSSHDAGSLKVRRGDADLSSRDLQAHKQRLNEYCTVNAIMKHEVFAVDLASDVRAACNLVLENDLSYLYVTEQSRLVGILEATDFLRLSFK